MNEEMSKKDRIIRALKGDIELLSTSCTEWDEAYEAVQGQLHRAGETITTQQATIGNLNTQLNAAKEGLAGWIRDNPENMDSEQQSELLGSLGLFTESEIDRFFQRKISGYVTVQVNKRIYVETDVYDDDYDPDDPASNIYQSDIKEALTKWLRDTWIEYEVDDYTETRKGRY